METVQDLKTVPSPKESIEEIDMDDELFLFDDQNPDGPVHTLNSGAALVWLLCDGERDAASISQEIARTYELPEREVITEVQDALARFQSLGLLQA